MLCLIHPIMWFALLSARTCCWLHAQPAATIPPGAFLLSYLQPLVSQSVLQVQHLVGLHVIVDYSVPSPIEIHLQGLPILKGINNTSQSNTNSKLLRMHSTPRSRQLIKTLNSIHHRIESWWTPLMIRDRMIEWLPVNRGLPIIPSSMVNCWEKFSYNICFWSDLYAFIYFFWKSNYIIFYPTCVHWRQQLQEAWWFIENSVAFFSQLVHSSSIVHLQLVV